MFADQLTLHIEVRGEEEGAAYQEVAIADIEEEEEEEAAVYQEVAIVDIGSRDQIVFIYTAPHLTT